MWEAVTRVTMVTATTITTPIPPMERTIFSTAPHHRFALPPPEESLFKKAVLAT